MRYQSKNNNIVQVRLDQYTIGTYKHGSLAKRSLWLVTSLLFFQTQVPWPSALKRLLLRCFGAKVGHGVVIKPNTRIKYPWRLCVGEHAWIGETVWIDNLDRVTIGANCCISQGAYLLTGNHDYSKSTFNLITEPIILEEGVWIGAKAIVGPGVTCQSHSVLAAGSNTFADLKAMGIYQGNPATWKRQRDIKA
jgi:putative colanic acid biosynthesis acetyltransferase WcaF